MKFYSKEEVIKMSRLEIHNKYEDILYSMKLWDVNQESKVTTFGDLNVGDTYVGGSIARYASADLHDAVCMKTSMKALSNLADYYTCDFTNAIQLKTGHQLGCCNNMIVTKVKLEYEVFH